MISLLKKFSLALLLIGLAVGANAQCNDIAKSCQQYMDDDHISDGQAYRAFLVDEEVAEFRTTFFEDSKYRIAACSGLDKGSLTFRVLDESRNELFTNADFDHVSAWNFMVENTVDCIIEAQLNPDVTDSGCAVLLISFER